MKPIHYTLTSLDQIACHGTSFPSAAAAKNYAFELQRQWGLCKSFIIGCYKDGKHIEVYRSHPKN
jgi:hypothetical protein